VIVHNEAETWTAVKPEISANDAFQDGRAIKLMVAVGATLPEHYLSDGDNNNRATATQMGLPKCTVYPSGGAGYSQAHKRPAGMARSGIIKTGLRPHIMA
jgi:hypothetical protein